MPHFFAAVPISLASASFLFAAACLTLRPRPFCTGGVGFAPCLNTRRDFLINLIEAVEDIPGTALHEGTQWEWETFEEVSG